MAEGLSGAVISSKLFWPQDCLSAAGDPVFNSILRGSTPSSGAIELSYRIMTAHLAKRYTVVTVPANGKRLNFHN